MPKDVSALLLEKTDQNVLCCSDFMFEEKFPETTVFQANTQPTYFWEDEPTQPSSEPVVAELVLSFRTPRQEEKQQSIDDECIHEQAMMNRRLVAATMEDDWLGLQLLALLRKYKKLTFGELAKRVGHRLENVGYTIARLARTEALDLDDESALCNDRGNAILESIEKNAKVNVNPD